MSDLLYSQPEEDLRAAVRSLLAARADPAGVIARTEAEDGPYDPELWKSLARDIGAAGLLVPEDLGGAGAGHREAAVVLEELGVTPAPFLTGAVIAVEALLACGDGEVRTELLGEVAEGSRVAVLAVPWSASAPRVSVRADEGRLTGRVTSVADAAAAEVLLVPAQDGLYAVAAADVAIGAGTPLDPTRPLARIGLDSVPGRPLGGSGAAVERALLAGAGLLASEQVGLAEWCLTETVRYLKERRQFARQVGGFQAVKHRLARLWLELVSARATARYAADALATGSDDAPVAVAVAQSYCADAAVHAAEEALQLHGGIGMTWEHPLHLYLKRAKSDQLALGAAGRHRAVLAGLVDLPGA